MRRSLLLLAVLAAGCSGKPPLAKEPPAPVTPPDAITYALGIDTGKEISYATSSDKIAQLANGTIVIRGIAPGVGSFEYRDKAGKPHLAGRIDGHGALSVQRPTAETGDYLLFMSLLFLCPRGAISPTAASEEVKLLPDPTVYVFGKATWSLGEETEYMERKCRLVMCESVLDIAGRENGRLTGRMKARLTARYDAASRVLLALEARVRADYLHPDDVDAAPECTILLRLKE